MLTAGLYAYLSPRLPSVETLKSIQFQTPLRVYSQDLKVIGEFGEKRRTPIEFAAIPQHLVHAILAAEDDGFYRHIGVDFAGLMRAAFELASTGSIQTGGSTITMQVARNFFLTRERSFIRKFNEILLALRIEDELDKNEIFSLYANKIYLGNRAYGIEAAAMTYYGRSVGELSLAEIAMIAGLPKAPSRFNPIINPERAMSRRNWILGRMLKLDFIGPEEYEVARTSPAVARYHGASIDYSAPYAAEEARRFALDMFGPAAYTEGYIVITTVDVDMQRSADKAVTGGLFDYDWRHGYRGPEAHVEAPQERMDLLNSTPVVAGLEPAIVTGVTDTSISLITKSHQDVTLTQDSPRIRKLRKYISESRISTVVKNLNDVFSAGDVIRIGHGADGPYLAQVPAAQAALVALDPNSGGIRAIVGGFDFAQSHFNRVTQARRQPGSSFKPFIYTAALEHGMTAASIINDAPVVLDNNTVEKAWRPENSSGQFYGPTRLREALYRSRNLVSIRILRSIGVDTALNTAAKFGFNTREMPRNLSLALGTYALTPLELATGFSTFANGGFKISPYLIERIENLNGEVLYQHSGPRTPDSQSHALAPNTTTSETAITAMQNPLAKPELDDPFAAQDKNSAKPTAQRILEPRVAFLMDSMLKDVVIRGTGSKARSLNRNDLAGKTGTTNGPRDAWFSGYSPDLVTTVWLGFDDNKLLGRREFGGSAALPIWMDFMAEALAGRPEKIQPQPADMVSIKIDPNTGLRAAEGAPNAIFELFREEYAPELHETLHGAPEYTGPTTPLPEDIW